MIYIYSDLFTYYQQTKVELNKNNEQPLKLVTY